MSSSHAPASDALAKASTLSEALPYMRRFSGDTFVVKFGGSAMVNSELARSFARDVVLLKQVGINPVVVHGGGPQIGAMLARLDIETSFEQGLRITDKASVEIVEMVLAGSINKRIAAAICDAGGTAIGLSGKDGRADPGAQTHFAACATRIRISSASSTSASSASRRRSTHGCSTALRVRTSCRWSRRSASATTARPTTSTPIRLRGPLPTPWRRASCSCSPTSPAFSTARGRLIGRLDPAGARALIADGTVAGGMVPKIETCISAVVGHAEAAHILDGRVPHALLLEIFTEHGVGTMIAELRT